MSSNIKCSMSSFAPKILRLFWKFDNFSSFGELLPSIWTVDKSDPRESQKRMSQRRVNGSQMEIGQEFFAESCLMFTNSNFEFSTKAQRINRSIPWIKLSPRPAPLPISTCFYEPIVLWSIRARQVGSLKLRISERALAKKFLINFHLLSLINTKNVFSILFGDKLCHIFQMKGRSSLHSRIL